MGKSVSVVLGQGSIQHNNRISSPPHVDPSLTPQNVILVKKDLNDVYLETFGESLAKYNARQRCKNNIITDYLAHIANSKNGQKVYYELIVQIGDRYDTGIGSPDAEVAKKILIEYLDEFMARNPNMIVINAVIHMDEPEGSPHLHVDFLPVARNQTRGLETKNSFNKALKQQGFDFQSTPPPPIDDDNHLYHHAVSRYPGALWCDAERKELGKLLERHGITWDNQHIHRRHLSTSEYKACGEIVAKLVREMPPITLDTRPPNTAMRIAGVKSTEVLVPVTSLLALQEETKILRAQAKVMHTTLHNMDTAKITQDTYVKRTLKAAAVREQRIKDQYSTGTAEEYQILVGKYNSVIDKYNTLAHEYNTLHDKSTNLEANISTAIRSATEPFSRENINLKTELKSANQTITAQDNTIHMLCQALEDIMRAIFMVKYKGRKSESNPYLSALTEMASYLIDALEAKARTTLRNANCNEYADGLDGMGISQDLLDDIQRNFSKNKTRKHEHER